MMQSEAMKPGRILAVLVLLIATLCSGFWAYRLYAARRRASEMMELLSKLQVGITQHAQAVELMKQLDQGSWATTDCFGGPCLQGTTYSVDRPRFPLLKWWPKTTLSVDLFYSQGGLAIKRLNFNQESPDSHPVIVVVENMYPFPERHWDVDLPSGFKERDEGNLVLITIDRRAAKSQFDQTYDLNLNCFVYLHGCPYAGSLQIIQSQ